MPSPARPSSRWSAGCRRDRTRGVGPTRRAAVRERPDVHQDVPDTGLLDRVQHRVLGWERYRCLGQWIERACARRRACRSARGNKLYARHAGSIESRGHRERAARPSWLYQLVMMRAARWLASVQPSPVVETSASLILAFPEIGDLLAPDHFAAILGWGITIAAGTLGRPECSSKPQAPQRHRAIEKPRKKLKPLPDISHLSAVAANNPA